MFEWSRPPFIPASGCTSNRSRPGSSVVLIFVRWGGTAIQDRLRRNAGSCLFAPGWKVFRSGSLFAQTRGVKGESQRLATRQPATASIFSVDRLASPWTSTRRPADAAQLQSAIPGANEFFCRGRRVGPRVQPVYRFGQATEHCRRRPLIWRRLHPATTPVGLADALGKKLPIAVFRARTPRGPVVRIFRTGGGVDDAKRLAEEDCRRASAALGMFGPSLLAVGSTLRTSGGTWRSDESLSCSRGSDAGAGEKHPFGRRGARPRFFGGGGARLAG